MSTSALKYRQITIVKLSGPLIWEFGREHHRQLDTGGVQETFSALRNTLPGFKEAVMRLQCLDMRFAVYRNHRSVGEDGFSTYGAREVRITPVIAGSKRVGLAQTIIGIAMVAVAAITAGGIGEFVADGAWGFVGATGTSLTLGSVVQVLSP